LNDPAGIWIVKVKDAATGIVFERPLELAASN